MKKLSDHVTLKGQLETITVTEFRQAPGAVLAMVELGKTFVISKDGKPVAVLSKLPGETLATEVKGDGSVHYVK